MQLTRFGLYLVVIATTTAACVVPANAKDAIVSSGHRQAAVVAASTRSKRRPLKKKPSKPSKTRNKKPATASSRADVTIITGASAETSILHCAQTTLLMAGNNLTSIKVGSAVIKVPESTALTPCSDCSSVFRMVTAISAPDASGPFACPPSAPSCIKVTTTFALVKQMFGPDLIQGFQLTGKENTLIESAFNCSHGPAQSRRFLDGEEDTATVMTTHGARSDLDQIWYNELGREQQDRLLFGIMPESCSDWASVNSDGRCSYTNCFVGKTGNPVDCFNCKSTCNNGCGPANRSGVTALIPTFIPFIFDFTETCCNHDLCYSSANVKSDCDLTFLTGNLASCAEKNAPTIIARVLSGLPLSNLVLYKLGACALFAVGYYMAVALGGASAYHAAQNDQKMYENSSVCVAKCPTTQESGGQGVTTLRVDVLSKTGSFPVTYEMYTVPDGLEVVYEGTTLFSTGGLVSGGATVSVTMPGTGTGTVVDVTIDAPNSGTAWDVSIGCALAPS